MSERETLLERALLALLLAHAGDIGGYSIVLKDDDGYMIAGFDAHRNLEIKESEV